MPARWVSCLAFYLGCSTGDVLVTLATLLLVGATIWTVLTMKAQRKASIRPVVIYRIHSGENRGYLNGVGSGIAINVRAWFGDGKGGISKVYRWATMLPNESQAVRMEEGDPMYYGPAPVEAWIRFEDAEGSLYHSRRDASGKWHIGKRGEPLPKGVEDA